ncbi:MAG: PD40 domain-containing protein [Bacteroidetes bacterium]|nr:PD40 domain-containing protein [Bacteroidota bacterium]
MKKTIFTSRRKYKENKLDVIDLLPYEDIYAAKKTENGWILLTDKTELKNYLPENVNTKKHDASITYTADGKTIFTYKKDAIWQSDYVNETWSPLKKLNENINVNKFNVPSVTISSDGNTLFFVATKKDGMGGKDIYKSVKKPSGEWEIPTVLSANINSKEDEDAPFLTQDGKTLYFSSKGRNTMGGYDIYKSELINNEWNVAQNIGIPFNSPSDDIFFIVNHTSENGFFSSNRIGGYGDFDLFSFSTQCKNLENIEIRGIVYDNTNKKPLSAKLTLTNINTNTVESSTSSVITNGKFLLVAKPENSYKLTIEAEGFNTQTISFSTPKQCEYFQSFSEISLEQVVADSKNYQVATVRNSFFNSKELSDITPANKEAIQREVPFVKIETDENYDIDLKLISYSRNLNPATTPNFSIISDTIPVELLASTVNTNTEVETETSQTIPQFESVYFDFDNSSLTKEAKKELDKLAKFLQSADGKTMVLNITGHADGKRDLELNKKIFAKRKIPFTIEAAEQRSKEYNKQLSKNRAEKTSIYLKNKGVKSTQLTVDYVGEDQPELPNKNIDGSNNLDNQKQNRRVTLKLSKQSVL